MVVSFDYAKGIVVFLCESVDLVCEVDGVGAVVAPLEDLGAGLGAEDLDCGIVVAGASRGVSTEDVMIAGSGVIGEPWASPPARVPAEIRTPTITAVKPEVPPKIFAPATR